MKHPFTSLHGVPGCGVFLADFTTRWTINIGKPTTWFVQFLPTLARLVGMDRMLAVADYIEAGGPIESSDLSPLSDALERELMFIGHCLNFADTAVGFYGGHE